MPGLGRNIGDAYIDVHGDLGPFRRDVRQEAARAGAESGEEYDRSLSARLKRLRLSLGGLRSSLGRINAALGERFDGVDIGLGRLRGSRNDFLNIVGTMAGTLERVLGGAIRGTFQALGGTITAFGNQVAKANGPVGALGKAFQGLGNSISRIGGGGLDGLIIQVGAVIVGFQLLVAAVGPLVAGFSGLLAAGTALAVGLGGALLGGILALGPALVAAAGGVGVLTLALTDLSKEQQSVFAPLKTLLDEVRSTVQQALFRNAGDQVNSLVTALRPLGALLGSLAGVFSDWATDVLAAIGPNGALSQSFQTIGTGLPSLLRSVLDLVSGLSGGLTGLFAGAIPGAQRLLDGINSVVASFSEWSNSVEGQQQINTFMQQAVDLLGRVWDLAKQVGITLGNLWNLGGAATAQVLIGNLVGLFERFNATLATPEGKAATISFFQNAVAVTQALGPVLGAVINLFNTLDSTFNRLAFQAVADGLTSVINGITSFVSWTQRLISQSGQVGDSVRRMATSFTSFASGVVAAVQRVISTTQTFVTIIRAAVSAVVTTVGRLASQGIAAFNRFQVGVAQAVQRVVSSVTGFVGRIQSNFATFGRIVQSAVNAAVSALSRLAGQAAAALVRFQVSVAQGVQRAVANLARFASQAGAALAGLGSTFYRYGVNAMQGLYNGVVGAAGRVISYVRGLAGQVADAFASALGIASPSKVFASYGGNIIDGLVRGMRRREKDAEAEGDRTALAVIHGAQRGLQSARESLQNTTRLVLEGIAAAGRNPALDKAFKAMGERTIRLITNGLDDGREAAAGDIKTIIEKVGELTRKLMKGEDKKTQRALSAQGAALQKWVKGQGAALDAVWREVDRAGTRIETARDKLKELQQEFNNLRESTAESLRGELDLGAAIDQETGKATFESVASQVSGLASRMKTFASLLKKLIASGIPPLLVQEVAALGSVQGTEVARALLSGTDAQRQDLVADFNSIQASTAAIGKALAEQMFGAGIEAQKGLIAGLEANRDALIKAAQRIAKRITDEVKKELGIKSPSRVFKEIGTNIVEGLAQGIDGGKSRVTASLNGLVDPSVMDNLNPTVSAMATQGQSTAAPTVTGGGIAPGAITVVTPYANPRLVAVEVLDALAAQGK